MRGIGRYILNALTALSLVLCVATAALWARSYVIHDDIQWTRSNGAGFSRTWGVYSERGRVLAVRANRWLGNVRYNRFGFIIEFDRSGPVQSYVIDANGKVAAGGIKQQVGDNRLSLVGFPLWFPTIVFALVPAGRLIPVIRKRVKTRTGHCPNCDYDLRATPDRCPECGAVPTEVKA
jgi:hypothetical protein